MKRAVVIGSGMGGLTSARLLQQHGWDVTVLEQHFRAGGFLHRFFRVGTAYDTGFHYAGSLGEDQVLRRCLRHLGVGELQWRELDPDGFDELRFPDLTVRVPQGRENYRDRLIGLFPAEREGLHRYFDWMAQASQAYSLFHLRTDVDISKVLQWESTTVVEVLDSCVRDPQLRAVLCGQALLYGVLPHEAPFGLHALVSEHFLEGAHSLDGGGDRLAMAMVRKLRADGGRIRFRSRVSGIEVDGREARAVVLDSGERIEADLVVSNAHPKTTVGLLPDAAVRRTYRQRIEDLRPGLAHLGVYLQLDGPVPSLARHNLYRFHSWDLERVVTGTAPGNCEFYFATAPAMHGGPTSGGNPMMVVTGLPYEAVERWEAGRDEDYEAYKQALLDTVVDRVKKDVPDASVVRAEASTPLTTVHYTGSPRGAMYGNYHSIDQMGRYRVSSHTRVKNLLMVGHGVGMPGILGVTLSAYHAIGSVVGLEGLIEAVRTA